MSFISIRFLIFLAFVLLLLKVLKEKKQQQIILLAASYLFYALGSARFLIVLVVLSVSVWYIARQIQCRRAAGRLAKGWLVAGVCLCVGVLCYFKYQRFFAECFSGLLGQGETFIRVVLPLGMSFYIFQAISYLCDVYAGKIQAASLFHTMLYIGFFPQIVSGPIVRAGGMLEQFKYAHPITWLNLSNGGQRFLLGMFKKVVVADRLSVAVNAVFDAPAAYSGISLLFAVAAYSVQIYCDFSGYSDMAIGTAKMMGYDLTDNFDLPYLAANPTEFWRRWHISLSSWFRDYVYIPLGGSRKGTVRTLFNLFAVMVISGIWHGAGWNFVAWGAAYGMLSAAYRLYAGRKKKEQPHRCAWMHWAAIAANTSVVCLLWVLFRANSIQDAWLIYRRMFTLAEGIRYSSVYALIFTALLLAVHIAAYIKGRGHCLQIKMDLSRFWPKVILCMLVLLMAAFAYIGDGAFIYAQF